MEYTKIILNGNRIVCKINGSKKIKINKTRTRIVAFEAATRGEFSSVPCNPLDDYYKQLENLIFGLVP